MFVLFFIFNKFPGIHVLFSSEEKRNKKRLKGCLRLPSKEKPQKVCPFSFL